MWYEHEEQFKTENGYSINGTWFPRVTRIIDIKAKPALDNFLKEMGSFSAAEDVKNKSAAEGTLVHTTIQKLALGQAVAVPPEIEVAATAFQRFYEERKILFHPEYIEKRVWSSRHRYAGTIDALATIDGKFGVVDIKTSTGFYPEYNLQTAAYVSALQEFPIQKAFGLPREIQTRWILRVNQHQVCRRCSSTLRSKGGKQRIQTNGLKTKHACHDGEHEWGVIEGDVELREFPYIFKDMKAFVAAKILWEWQYDYWLRKIGYSN